MNQRKRKSFISYEDLEDPLSPSLSTFKHGFSSDSKKTIDDISLRSLPKHVLRIY